MNTTTPLTDLQLAVIEQLGYTEVSWLNAEEELTSLLRDIANSGADAGWPGFCYYCDTCDFTDAHRAHIVATIEDMADSLGEDPITMVRNFRCLGTDNPVSASEVRLCLYYGQAPDNDATTLIENALAWFALEETARTLVEE
jgi:hypothetical protein